MTSYDFEKTAKELVIRFVKEKYGEEYRIEDINMVWFAHVLGNKKAIMIDSGNRDNHRIYEVTYNFSTDQMYIDIYEKKYNPAINIKPF